MERGTHPQIVQLAAALPYSAPLSAEDVREPLASSAVAALLRTRPQDEQLELLLIRRAEREGDVWSGHVALPGGRAEPDDVDIVHTAQRETMEEVGIDLSSAGGAQLLGALPPLAPRIERAPRLSVHPFVWAVSSDAVVRPNEEVAGHTWVALEQLTVPELQVLHRFVAPNGTEHELPGVRVGADVLWGITLRIVLNLLDHLR